MILAVNLGVCPDYCYCNLRHLFAYNNILWEYHSPRETWHPHTQNRSNFQASSSLLCIELEPRTQPHNDVWKVEKCIGDSDLRGLNMSRG